MINLTNRITNRAIGPATSGPMKDFVRPPVGLLPKVRHYVNRYGLIHSIAAYIGRKWPAFWHVFGTTITRSYLERWKDGSSPRWLNLGGGGVIFDRWLTADIDPRSDVYVNICRKLPFEDNSIDLVYLEEVIEHVGYDQGMALLQEIHRILKPGGHFRLTTPSLDWFACRALHTMAGNHEINDVFYLHEHRYIYSELAMAESLAHIGFDGIARSCYQDPMSSFGFLDTHCVRHPGAAAESSQYWDMSKR